MHIEVGATFHLKGEETTVVRVTYVGQWVRYDYVKVLGNSAFSAVGNGGEPRHLFDQYWLKNAE